jgi:acyl carrier protein
MNPPPLRPLVLAALARIAPEADLEALDPGADVREALDLDSMDVLRLATDLHAQLHVEVPESDYARIVTVDGCVAYLAARLGVAPS